MLMKPKKDILIPIKLVNFLLNHLELSICFRSLQLQHQCYFIKAIKKRECATLVAAWEETHHRLTNNDHETSTYILDNECMRYEVISLILKTRAANEPSQRMPLLGNSSG